MAEQVGGTHYQSDSGYQHWDWVSDISLGYLGATATKYICRHGRKGGRQDIEKALTYVQKMREVGHDHWGSLPCHLHGHDTALQKTLVLANSLAMPELEHRLCIWIATAVDVDDLIEAESALEQMASDMPRDSEESAMRQYDRTGHPAPFGYEGDE